MKCNPIMRHEDLTAKLLQSVDTSNRTRMVRIITNPWRMFYPKFLKMTARSVEKRSDTFWGGEIKVILPELVSTFIWRDGFFEADVCTFFIVALKKGMTFIDIGSHFGFFTLLGSYLVGREGNVLAFEPTPDTYRQLQKNISDCSEFTNIKAMNCAAYSENTSIVFHDRGLEFSAFNSRYSSRKSEDDPVPENEVMVKARKIDDVLKEMAIKSVDFIKIDAESSELEVVKGMSETLKSCRPTIVVEVGDNAPDGVPRSKEVIDSLKRMGYSAYEAHRGNIVPHVSRDRYEYGNLLLLAD